VRGPLNKVGLADRPPHPKFAERISTSPRKRGEVNQMFASIQFKAIMLYSIKSHPALEGHPDDAAGGVASVAMRGLLESAGQFPLLRFIAPLNRRVGDDVIGLAA